MLAPRLVCSAQYRKAVVEPCAPQIRAHEASQGIGRGITDSPFAVLRSHHRCMDSPEEPHLRSKLVFWLLLSVLSVALAEVTVGVGASCLCQPGRGCLSALVLRQPPACVRLVGLPPWLAFVGSPLVRRRALRVVRVLHHEGAVGPPPWGDTISIGHIDIISFIVLAFFWHPFMAFIFPLAVAEAGGTKSRWVVDLFPTRVSGVLQNRRTWLLLLGLGAAIHGLLAGSPGLESSSPWARHVAVASLTMLWWRRDDRQQRWSLRALLPNDRQGRWIAVLLAAHMLCSSQRGHRSACHRSRDMLSCGCSTAPLPCCCGWRSAGFPGQSH